MVRFFFAFAGVPAAAGVPAIIGVPAVVGVPAVIVFLLLLRPCSLPLLIMITGTAFAVIPVNDGV